MVDDMTEEHPYIHPAANGHMRLEDVTGLLTWVSAQIGGTEARITETIRANGYAAEQRWAKFETTIDGLDRRVSALEDRNSRDDNYRDARVRPMRSFLGWFGDHYKDLAIIVLAALAALDTLKLW